MLEERASALVLHSRINYAYRRMQEHLTSTHTWGARNAGVLWARPVAYFSAEFGLHESVPIYSGGLGILAGDHIKAASDLGIPLVGIGLYYDQGYFTQRLDMNGYQQEDYRDVDSSLLPIEQARDASGEPVTISIDTRTGTLFARVWKLAVGRNTLLLLDSDVEGNQPEDRDLTSRLYGGDDRVRIRQELLLGVGGVKALTALGISPGVVHLNEGHSAFAALELACQRMVTEGIGAAEALRRISSQVVFTTHTPVPAGHDRFSADLVDEHLGPLRAAMGMSADDLLALGRTNPSDRERRVLHDGARAEAVAPRQRCLVASRPGLTRHVDAALSGTIGGTGADRPHHQRHSRPHVARAADAPALRPPPRPGLDGAMRGALHVGRHRRYRRRGIVGDPPDAQDRRSSKRRGCAPCGAPTSEASRSSSSTRCGSRSAAMR